MPERVNIIRAHIAIFQVIRMLPNVQRKDRRFSVERRRILIGGADNSRLPLLLTTSQAQPEPKRVFAASANFSRNSSNDPKVSRISSASFPVGCEIVSISCCQFCSSSWGLTLSAWHSRCIISSGGLLPSSYASMLLTDNWDSSASCRCIAFLAPDGTKFSANIFCFHPSLPSSMIGFLPALL